MSNQAAKIMRKLGGEKSSGNQLMLGTVTDLSPFTLQLDDVSFEITSGILINECLLGRSESGSLSGSASFAGESGGINISGATYKFNGRLSPGDRVMVNMVNEACFVIVCKVRKV